MDFAQIHSINPKNESLRSSTGKQTFKRLLAGVSVDELKPNPLKCNCGNYPTIERNGNTFDALCPNEACDHQLFNAGRTYQEAIFQWNESNDTEFNPQINKIHPLAWFSVGFDSTDYLLKQIDKIEHQLTLIESTELSTKETRLISIIRSWNHFATVIASRLKKQKLQNRTEIQSEAKEQKPPQTRQKTEKIKTTVNDGIPNRIYNPDPDVSGPMAEYKGQIQTLGSAHYWCVEGHAVRTKICKHTNWLIPTYIVYVHNKGTRAGYQVRIDLRSIGIPYYSKMFNRDSLYESLADALQDLSYQFKKIKQTRKLSSIIERSKVKGNKTIQLDDIRGLRVVRSLWDSNHRAEITFSSPNDHAKARLQWTLGGKTTLSYSRYESVIKTALKTYLMHTKLSCKKSFAHGAKVPLNELEHTTKMKIVDVVSEHFGLSISDVAYHLTQLNPNVNIGYLTLSALREDNTASWGDYPMQIVSSQNKRGHLSGEVKKHDLLYNAECVCIDSILLSNFEEYTYQPSDVKFREAHPQMALLLSKRAVEMTLTLRPELNEEFDDIVMLSPEELVNEMQEELITEAEANMAIFEGKEIEYKVEDDKISMYLDGVKSLATVRLDDWAGSVEAASTQVLVLAYVLASTGRLMRNKTNYKTKDLARRYEALGISEEDIDLNNVRFLAARASKCGMRNLYIKPSGRIEYHQKASREHDDERILFSPPKSLNEFESIVESLYSLESDLNNDEKRLIQHAFNAHYS